MFTDECRRIVWDQIRQHDLRAFARWLSPEILTAAAAKAGIRVGQSPLYVVNLAWLAVSSALHISKNFADVLTLTLKLLEDTEGFPQTLLGREHNKAKRCRRTRRRCNTTHTTGTPPRSARRPSPRPGGFFRSISGGPCSRC